MLEADEAKKAHELLNGSGKSLPERFNALLGYYNQVTGMQETNPNAVLHHFVDAYGPPCEKCGKPYRTPRAKICAACGNVISNKKCIIFGNQEYTIIGNNEYISFGNKGAA
jgi:hypothetical protein